MSPRLTDLKMLAFVLAPSDRAHFKVQIARGVERYAPFVLSTCLDQFFALCAAARDPTIISAPDAPPIAAVTDPPRPQRALDNVVRSGVRATVPLETADEDGTISIEDEGPGGKRPDRPALEAVRNDRPGAEPQPGRRGPRTVDRVRDQPRDRGEVCTGEYAYGIEVAADLAPNVIAPKRYAPTLKRSSALGGC